MNFRLAFRLKLQIPDFYSISSTDSVRRSSCIALKTSSVVSFATPVSAPLNHSQRLTAFHNERRFQKQRILSRSRDGKYEKLREIRCNTDLNAIDPDQLAGPIRYCRGEGAAIILKGIMPALYDIDKLTKHANMGVEQSCYQEKVLANAVVTGV